MSSLERYYIKAYSHHNDMYYTVIEDCIDYDAIYIALLKYIKKKHPDKEDYTSIIDKIEIKEQKLYKDVKEAK